MRSSSCYLTPSIMFSLCLSKEQAKTMTLDVEKMDGNTYKKAYHNNNFTFACAYVHISE